MNGQPRFAPRLAGGVLAAAIGGLFALAAPAAVAATFETESVKGSFDSTISFGMQWRMSDTSCSIIGNDNGGCVPTSGTLGELVNGPGFGFTSNPDFNYLQSDNGNLNYKKNQLVSAALKGNHELALAASPTAGPRSAASRGCTTRPPTTPSAPRCPTTPRTSRSRTSRCSTSGWRKDFEIGGRPAKVKVGNQVLSWGEDIFIYGGINVINAIDLTRAHKPGVQLKEIFRPAPIASFNIGATNNLSIEGFWQFRWNAFRFDPVGTYFSSGDVIGNGPAARVRSQLGAGRAARNRRRPRLDQQRRDHSRRPAVYLRGPAGGRHRRARHADAVAPEHQPVRLRGALEAGQLQRRVGVLLPALQRQDPVRGLRQRSVDHRQPVRAGLLPAVRQEPQPVRRVGQRQHRRLGGRRRGQLPPEGRRGHRSHGAARGRVLRVLRAGHVSGLRRHQEVAGAPDRDLPARTERRPGLAAARPERGRGHAAGGGRDRVLPGPRPLRPVPVPAAELRAADQVVDRAGRLVRRRLPARVRHVDQPDAADRRLSGTSAGPARTRSRSSRDAWP